MRGTIYCEFSRGSKATEAYHSIIAVLGKKCVIDETMRRWFVSFSDGDIDLEDKPRSGRKRAFDDERLLAADGADPEATSRELARRIGQAYRTTDRRPRARFSDGAVRWVPHALMDARKSARVSICQSLLVRPQRKDFLADLIEGDESWFMYDTNARRAYWVPRDAKLPTQPKSDLHPKKILLRCF